MKKFAKIILIVTFALIGFRNAANAQYTKLFDFAIDTVYGINPAGDLIQASDGMLYGMTQQGGTDYLGTLFQYNPASNIFTKKLDFVGTNGSNPAGSLIQASDGMLYGMAAYGGTIGFGVLFQYNPMTNSYTDKLDFAGASNGSSPNGSLMQASDGMIYGMTVYGGVNGFGVLFQYNPVTNTYTKKLDFDGITNGSYPGGELMQASDGMIYGMTTQGGANNMGVLFQYNPTTSVYSKEFDFDGSTNGGYPSGHLLQASDGMLYGLTQQGGANNIGVLFQYNPVGSTCIVKFSFAGISSGGYPPGSLMQASDGILYGMTAGGGADTMGVLFQFNPATSTFNKIFDFAGAINGRLPIGSLMQANDGALYSMTFMGGASTLCPYGCGTIFKYGVAAGIAENSLEKDFSISPNPFTTQTTIDLNIDYKNATIKIIDVLGKEFKIINFSGKQVILEREELKNGIYFIQIISEEKLIATNKIIIN